MRAVYYKHDMVRVFFMPTNFSGPKIFKNDNLITSTINNLQGYTMIKIIFRTIFTYNY